MLHDLSASATLLLDVVDNNDRYCRQLNRIENHIRTTVAYARGEFTDKDRRNFRDAMKPTYRAAARRLIRSGELTPAQARRAIVEGINFNIAVTVLSAQSARSWEKGR